MSFTSSRRTRPSRWCSGPRSRPEPRGARPPARRGTSAAAGSFCSRRLSASELVGVGLALLALPPLGQPVGEGPRVDELLVPLVEQRRQVVAGVCL